MKFFLLGFGVGLGIALALAPEATRRRRLQQVSPSKQPEQQATMHPSRFSTVGGGASQAMNGAAQVLNNISRQELMWVHGIGPSLADRIIRNRPYSSAKQLRERGIIPEKAYQRLKKDLLDKKRH